MNILYKLAKCSLKLYYVKMELTYVSTRLRSEFGRQCLFSDRGPEILDSFGPNKYDFSQYILRDPVDQAVQCSAVMAEHEANTMRPDIRDNGINHAEGGWPKDVNFLDPEMTQRYRRKIEKDEHYNPTILQLSTTMEHTILQNNAVNIYQQYYEECEEAEPVEPMTSRTINVFRDQRPGEERRPTTHISWSPDGGTKIAVSHCITDFQVTQAEPLNDGYIWDIDNPNTPFLTLKPAVAMVALEYNQKDPHSLVSGMATGQVAVWDTRKGSEPVDMSLRENSHRDPVSTVLWINSKSGTEFFSGSTDGQVKWWDTRNLSEPYEQLIIDVTKPDEQDLSRALGVFCLEYEPTIPTRYMLGTDQGWIVGGNRKGKLPSEKIVYKFPGHAGPIYSIMRNPAFAKNYLTVAEWTAKIWSEDCKESAIIWTSPQRYQLTYGAWSPARFSVLYLARADGTLDVWDILQQQRDPMLSIKVCDHRLCSMRVHEEGRLVAVGNRKGSSFLIEMSENLANNNKNDKNMLVAMFDRETRREKILEGRMREIKLKIKTEEPGGVEEEEGIETVDSKEGIPVAEEEYFADIEKEIQRRKGLAVAKPDEPDPDAQSEDIDGADAEGDIDRDVTTHIGSKRASDDEFDERVGEGEEGEGEIVDEEAAIEVPPTEEQEPTEEPPAVREPVDEPTAQVEQPTYEPVPEPEEPTNEPAAEPEEPTNEPAAEEEEPAGGEPESEET